MGKKRGSKYKKNGGKKKNEKNEQTNNNNLKHISGGGKKQPKWKKKKKHVKNDKPNIYFNQSPGFDRFGNYKGGGGSPDGGAAGIVG